jgi:hypothetical protein
MPSLDVLDPVDRDPTGLLEKLLLGDDVLLLEADHVESGVSCSGYGG